MVAPTVTSLASDLAAITARVAALEASLATVTGQVNTNAAKIAALDQSDDASGWKQWRENRGPK